VQFGPNSGGVFLTHMTIEKLMSWTWCKIGWSCNCLFIHFNNFTKSGRILFV